GEDVDAVVPETRDPDVAVPIRDDALRPHGTALDAPGPRDRPARRREHGDAAVAAGRGPVGGEAPAEVPEPDAAFGIDVDPIPAPEEPAPQERGPGRAVAAVRGLPVGLEHDGETAGI